MYIPKHFEQPNIEALHTLMRRRPLATLVTLSSGALDANHLPLHLSESPAPFGMLRGHVARANPVWSQLVDGAQVLAIFHGPNAYITPSWYPSKAETGRAVPTWNFAVVHAQGRALAIEDPRWLREHLAALTAHQEAGFAEPWHVSDAPLDYTEALLQAIVGVEITITRLSGKWKVSQNQPERNRAGVVRGLRDGDGDEAREMAALVEETYARIPASRAT